MPAFTFFSQFLMYDKEFIMQLDHTIKVYLSTNERFKIITLMT